MTNGCCYCIDPDTCIDCGACVPECPGDAIFFEDEVPKEHQEALARNRAFFKRAQVTARADMWQGSQQTLWLAPHSLDSDTAQWLRMR